jgi:hypothetical protein
MACQGCSRMYLGACTCPDLILPASCVRQVGLVRAHGRWQLWFGVSCDA